MSDELTKQAYKEVEGMIEQRMTKFEQSMKDEFIDLKEYISTNFVTNSECRDMLAKKKEKLDRWLMKNHAISASAIVIALMALGVKVTEILKAILKLG